MTLARWPNDGAVEIGELKVRDGHAIQGVKGSMSGIFSYADDRPKRWTGEKDAMLHGYWFHDWADQRYRVASIDTEQRTITLPEKPRHAFGFRKGQRYYAYNLLDLDPKFEDEKAGNFRLKADSPAFKIGFQPIPLEKIGLYKDDIRTSLPPTE
jgi:hypothetical protein